MRKKIVTLILSGAVITSLILVGCAPKAVTPEEPEVSPEEMAGPVTWRCDLLISTSHPDCIILAEACDWISKESGDRLVIELYPSKALGFEYGAVLRNLKDNAYECALCAPNAQQKDEPALSLTKYAEPCESNGQELALRQYLFPKMKELYAKWDIVLLAEQQQISTTMGWWTNVKGTCLADFKGKKIRIADVAMSNVYKDLGFSPQMVSLPDVYQALKTGVLDGAMTGYASGLAQHFDEVVKYFVRSHVIAGSWPMSFVVGKEAWDALPADIQEIVQRGIDAYVRKCHVFHLTEATHEANRLEMIGRGITILEIPEEERELIPYYTKIELKKYCEEKGGECLEVYKLMEPFLYPPEPPKELSSWIPEVPLLVEE